MRGTFLLGVLIIRILLFGVLKSGVPSFLLFGVLKLGVSFLGVLKIRILLFGVLYYIRAPQFSETPT